MDFKLMMLSSLGIPLATGGSFIPIVLYLVARWRANRDPAPDPQLGLKFAIYYFGTMALQLGLVGLTMLIYTLVKPNDEFGDSKGESFRVALGMILPAGAVFGGHLALLLRTNDKASPGVKRLFYGFNLMLVGLCGFVALVASCQALFHKGSTDGMGHFAGSALFVYGTLWGLLVWRFDRIVLGGPPNPFAEFGSVVAPPAPPPPAPLPAAMRAPEQGPSPYAPPRSTPTDPID
jgi:hypothetical protein